ncbi:NERD domain-containing protein [Streptomyces sp. SBST2-5]|uniref:NERD domain-containing protein n=1 Tax=Streptomyces composti TaxID=2720025 RepID=A0ABX1AC78_9ACTN|nr:nuclease-related domain-containing protein [Streptomyces composti]NJP52842.1 NERD domain-containing protein [Streptomyces composti]
MELEVTRWRRYGHDRLYASLPDGTAAGWADLKTGKITILRAEHSDDVIAALTPHLSDRHDTAAGPEPATAEPAAPPGLPPLTPDDDLAGNPPGAALRERLARSGAGRFERTLARLLRRPTEWESWEKGLTGEKRVGAELARLSRHGWRVLHSIPLAHDVDIDHLLIGPGGVFSINTKYCPKRAVWVGDDAVKIDHGKPRPYARKSRAEADRVRRVLGHYCRFPVPVEPVLVFAGATDLTVAATQLTVRVYQERQVASLAPLSGVLTADQVDQVHEIARHRQAWRLA